MALALDVLEARRRSRRRHKAARQAVVDAMFATEGPRERPRDLLIDENGDTTLTDYGLYVIEDGLPEFDSKIEAAAQ